MTLISARPQYLPPQIPAEYNALWLRQQFANLARAIPPQIARTIFSAQMIQATDDLILCDATSAPFTVTLLPANQVQFLRITIKKKDSSANAVTIAGTVDGVVNPTLATQYKGISIQSDGALWYKLASV